MVQIKDRLGELVGKFVRIATKDGTEFELKPKEAHKRRLLFNYKKENENDLIFTHKIKKNVLSSEDTTARDKFRETSYDDQQTILKEIVKESYPAFEDEKIDAIMQHYDSELLEEIYCYYGWVDKEIKEAQRKAALAAIKKLDGEETNPETKLQSKQQSESGQTSEPDKQTKTEKKT